MAFLPWIRHSEYILDCAAEGVGRIKASCDSLCASLAPLEWNNWWRVPLLLQQSSVILGRLGVYE